jgi:branched-chain amino acid transport system ATP-binding protein
MSTGELIVDDLTTGYTRAPILTGASLRVGRGEVVGLLGANGAGKTTLLRAISGSLRVWSGEIRLNDLVVTGRPAWTRVHDGLAHVPEGRHVFGPMTVRDNLRVAGLGTNGADERLERIYNLFPRLRERERQPAGSMSGGEQQMLAIGRALMTDPSHLLVDEMSAGLAPVVTIDLVDGLRRIHEEGVGILVVEQSPHVVAGLIERLYVLEHGRVASEGTLESVGGADALAARYLGVKDGVAQ